MRDATITRAFSVTIICCGFLAEGPALAAWPTQDTLPSQMLIPGHYSVGELPPNAEGEWYALTVSGSKVSLIPTTVHLRKAANPNATGDLSLPGAIVGTDTADSVLCLLRGGSWERRDEVPTWYVGDSRMSPGDTLPLRGEGGKKWRVTASKLEYFRPVEGKIFRIRVQHRPSARVEQLRSIVLGLSPRIRWIGDLDGDGRLDLFLHDDTSETGSRSWTLYLSGQARGKSLLGRAAEFGLPGC